MGKFIVLFFALTIGINAKNKNIIVSWTPTIIQIDTTNGKNDTLIFDSKNIAESNFTPMKTKSLINFGEKFKYEVTWGFITFGYTTIKVDDKIHKYQNRDCYKITTIATSAAKADFFGQKTRDTNFVYYDIKTNKPLYFKKIINEGKYHRKRSLRFDHRNKTALYKEKLIRISDETQDILGVIFMVRNKNLKVGDTYAIDVVDDGEFYSLKTEVKKREKINTEYGEFYTHKVEPFLQSNGIFKNEGKLWIWFTDDKKKIPLMIKAKIAVGSVKVKLIDYKKGK